MSPSTHSVQPSKSERAVRVFISSTFRDMHTERDHLVTVVFPELRERLEQLGLEFFDVDLRWGVPSKDANGETANSWEYCRQWIDRVEPFFVCILGQRYGWVPRVEDFKDEADRVRQASQPRSITDLEVHHAVLDERRKRRSYFYLRDTLVPAPAPDATIEERATYEEFVDPPEIMDQLAALKADIRACGRPVRGYSCRWEGHGFTDLDAFGEVVLEDLWSGVLRDDRYVSREAWRQVLGADPSTDPRYTDESQPVLRELWEQIVALARPAPASPLDVERDQMEAFAASRLQWFQGRACELQALTDFVESASRDAQRLAVVAAVPGQGKSALLARLHEQLKASPHVVITHFVGATERSATAYALVDRLLGELDRSGIPWTAEGPAEGGEPKRDFTSLCLRLAQRLGDYSGERRIVIMLDALNQLSDGHDLRWLPIRLGPSVRVAVSCVEDAAAKADGPEHRVLHALTSRRAAWLRVPLGPLTADDVRTIVVAYLSEYCHELDREHLDTLCAIPQACNPLFLLVMLNELRTLGGNDLNRIVPATIAAMPQDHPDTVSLFRWVLQRLEVFGTEAVRWWCLYLAYGRVGMSGQELGDLLARKLGAAGAGATEEARRTAQRIERGLRRYLQRRGRQLDFFHGQLRQAVLERYGPEADVRSVHREMGDYFTVSAKGTGPQAEWETNVVRGFSECVFHLSKAARHEQAVAVCTSFPFLLHKTRVGLLEGVFEDLEILRREAPAEFSDRLEVWADFFREHAHILRRGSAEWPAHKTLLHLAVEHAGDSPVSRGAERWLASGGCDWFWLRRIQPPPRGGRAACLVTFEGHTAEVRGALEVTNGSLLSWAWDNTLRLWDVAGGACLQRLEGHEDKVRGALELADGRLLSWAWDTTLRLWDVRSGTCQLALEGHTSSVNGALPLADGRLLSWSGDKTLRIWDAFSGDCLVTLGGHTGGVEGALELADGKLLSWACDNTLRLWDARSGSSWATLQGHTSWVKGALALADGRLLSWAGDEFLRLWDAHSGACLAVCKGHTAEIEGALELADGRLLSWAWDNTLRLWDGHDGACLGTLEGHTEGVTGALVLANGRLLSWSEDNTLRLWDEASGSFVTRLDGHTAGILGALAWTDGRLLSWSQDNTLRLWDADSGGCLATLKGHTGWVSGALLLADGRPLSWSEDRTLRLWDAHGGARNRMEGGHTASVNGVSMLADGRLLSWSEDRTLRLWDAHTGACLLTLDAHTSRVWGALELTDGRLLSWSDDKTLRLWDSHGGACLAKFEGHTGEVTDARLLSNGRLLSCSGDGMLRLWDLNSQVCLATARGHSGRLEDVLALDDGRLLEWGWDQPPRLWEGHRGAPVASLEGHTRHVAGAIELADGRLLSWAWDTTLRLWDERSGACLAAFEGHGATVSGALELTDGRVLSWAEERTLRLWDAHSGGCLLTLDGHTAAVVGALELTDGRVLSWAWDNTLRLWDAHSGGCLLTLNGHTAAVVGALELTDGRVLSWAWDNTLRLWDARSGACLLTLDGHTAAVMGALELADGQVLSWAKDTIMRLWDSHSGASIVVPDLDEAFERRPEWPTPRGVGLIRWGSEDHWQDSWGHFSLDSHRRTVALGHTTSSSPIAVWNADIGLVSRCLLSDGTAVVTGDDGQVCVLKLHHGHRRTSLAEAEAILASQETSQTDA